MPEPLTKLERRILDYLVEYLLHHTYQPSIREIGKRFDIRSTKTVSEYLQSLADKGWIERDPSRSRGVRLLGLELSPDTVTVPCYDDPAAAGAAGLDGAPEGLELDRRLAGANGTFFMTMFGDSMEGDAIRDQDLLLVDPVPAEELEDGDIVAARSGDEVAVKRYFRRDGEIVLEPANPDYAPILVPDSDQFDALGRVIAVFRRLRPTVAASAWPTAREESESAGS